MARTKGTPLNEILREAVKLPPMERAELVDRILESFRFADRRKIDARWAAEAESRIDAFERGELGTLSLDEVLGRIQKENSP